jgi:hypothetical protein
VLTVRQAAEVCASVITEINCLRTVFAYLQVMYSNKLFFFGRGDSGFIGLLVNRVFHDSIKKHDCNE